MQLPHQQNDFAPRDPKRAGAKTDRNRQNRSPAEIRLEKRPPILRPFEVGKRKSRFRICGENATCKKAGPGQSGDGLKVRGSETAIDATMRGVLSSVPTLCVAPSAARAMIRSSTHASRAIAQVFGVDA